MGNRYFLLALLLVATLATPFVLGQVSQDCLDQETCKEIDEVWQFIRRMLGVRGDSLTNIWVETLESWMPFNNVYPDQSTLSPGVVGDPFTGGGQPAPSNALDGCSITPFSAASEAVGKSNAGSLVNGVALVSSPHLESRRIGRGNHYGTSELVNLLEITSCLGWKAHGARLVVHDLSLIRGGDISGHGSHESGLDVDTGIYAYVNGQVVNLFEDMASGNGAQSRYTHPQALEANWQFIVSLQETYDLQYIGFDDRLVAPLEQYVRSTYGDVAWTQFSGVLRHWQGHSDHYHIRIKCPQDDTRCDGSYDGRASRPITLQGSSTSGVIGGGGPDTYDQFILDASREFGVPAALIKAVMAHESNFESDAISHTGCSGLMQVCGGSEDEDHIRVLCKQHRNLGPRGCAASCTSDQSFCQQSCSGSSCVSDDRFDPRRNIFSGTSTLQSKFRSVTGNGRCPADWTNEATIKATVASYNIGQGYLQSAISRSGGCSSYQTLWRNIQGIDSARYNNLNDQVEGTYLADIYLDYLAYSVRLSSAPVSSSLPSLSAGASLSSPSCQSSAQLISSLGSGTVSQTWGNWQNVLDSSSGFSGSVWVGKLSSNGPTDDINRIDAGRVTAMFFPCTFNPSADYELLYFFHGLTGFAQWDIDDRLVPQARTLSEQGRNYVLVVPELPWSTPDMTRTSSGGDNRGGQSDYDRHPDYAALHRDALLVVGEVLQANVQPSRITLVGHSAGGSSLAQAAASGAMNTIRPDYIVLSDSDYGWRGGVAKTVESNYLDSHPSARMVMVAQSPSREGSAHDPTGFAIDFARAHGGSAYASWNHNIYSGNRPSSLGGDSSLPRGTFTGTLIDDTSYRITPQVVFVPSSRGHSALGGWTLSQEYTSFFNQASSRPAPSVPTSSSSLASQGSLPSTCTYRDRQSDHDDVVFDPTGSGCTLCEEDKVSRSVTTRSGEELSFEICEVYADDVTRAVQNAIDRGFVVEDIVGFRQGRTYSRGTRFGQHAYGAAIDINRDHNGLYNGCDPQIESCSDPDHGGRWSESNPLSITRNSALYGEFSAIGWHWGGDWTTNQRDMMHFANAAR